MRHCTPPIRLLITIPGITPLTASAFLADIGDVHRFPSLRRMNAYLGLVPRCHDSGGKSRPGHITRESRKLKPDNSHAVDLPDD
ncbi:MAG: IS110 family transposase [Planctomycetes bacterium]|nr:IS110 family transposase [Planctomycetota bacterium]